MYIIVCSFKTGGKVDNKLYEFKKTNEEYGWLAEGNHKIAMFLVDSGLVDTRAIKIDQALTRFIENSDKAHKSPMLNFNWSKVERLVKEIYKEEVEEDLPFTTKFGLIPDTFNALDELYDAVSGCDGENLRHLIYEQRWLVNMVNDFVKNRGSKLDGGPSGFRVFDDELEKYQDSGESYRII